MWLPFVSGAGLESDGKLMAYFQCQIVNWHADVTNTLQIKAT